MTLRFPPETPYNHALVPDGNVYNIYEHTCCSCDAHGPITGYGHDAPEPAVGTVLVSSFSLLLYARQYKCTHWHTARVYLYMYMNILLYFGVDSLPGARQRTESSKNVEFQK